VPVLKEIFVSLSLDEVKRIAYLARIEISEAEAVQTQDQLNDILGLIESMRAVDTEGIEPMSHAQDLMLRLREDAVTESDQHPLFQSVAPQVEDGLYLVPKVIE
jgi:aspartyl-tRNA(Asn)/glutamyl-tRNA(Gln) amidotransferase subunit C